MNREIANCYYFTKFKIFGDLEDTRIEEYIDHWKWRSLIECDTQYTHILTKIFYANFLLIENLFLCTTYVCVMILNKYY